MQFYHNITQNRVRNTYKVLIETRGGGIENRKYIGRSCSDEPGLGEIFDENSVDKLVLGNCLDHHHPLLPQVGQHLQRKV